MLIKQNSVVAMKTSILVLVLVICSIFVASRAYAIPSLQLDIVNGTYVNDFDGDGSSEDDPFDEGMLNEDSALTLQALYKSAQSTSVPSKTFYLSCALMNLDGTRLNLSTSPLPSIIINGSTVNSSAWTYGKPNLMPPHGVFDTYYYQYAFNFAASDYLANGIYNVADSNEAHVNGYIHDFDLDVSDLNHQYALVFDLYTYETGSNGRTSIIKAPFSHNAVSSPAVPEPSTLALLGLGLLGLVKSGSRKKLERVKKGD